MFGKDQISDKDLLKQINQRMGRTGTGSQSKINVSVRQGNVTLSGTLQHAIHRDPILKAVARVAGVRRVIDQMQHTAKKATQPDANQHVFKSQRTIAAEAAEAAEEAAANEPVDAPIVPLAPLAPLAPSAPTDAAPAV
jgi:hypothetical protein